MNIHFISLGCDKNLVDSERILSELIKAGHSVVDELADADAVIINTCCFIHDAKQESINTILESSEYKETAHLKYTVITGCLAERYAGDIFAAIPEIDAVCGVGSENRICEILNRLEGGERHLILADDINSGLVSGKRTRSDINHYSYLKIAEGCDKHCTYCVIPDIKGSYRSSDFDMLVQEAEELAKDGVNELLVIAQETTLYGSDLYGKKRLPELLSRLCRIEGLVWIRLLYCYPEEITDELIEVMKTEKKICHYIDMPIQHASDRILKRMGRRTNIAQIKEIISKLRTAMPDIVIRTSLITGFPGETEEDHRELLDFIADTKLEKVGVFAYSREEGTPADKMSGQIRIGTKRKRRKELMLAQQRNVLNFNKELEGKEYFAIIDGRIPEEGVYIGRSYMDAPGIDGYIFIRSSRELLSGDMIRIRITGSADYDLLAEEV